MSAASGGQCFDPKLVLPHNLPLADLHGFTHPPTQNLLFLFNYLFLALRAHLPLADLQVTPSNLLLKPLALEVGLYFSYLTPNLLAVAL